MNPAHSTSDRPAPADPALSRAVRRLAVLTLVLLLALGAILLAPPVAFAGSDRADLTSGREITRYDVTADAAPDGTVDVVIDFDFDFGDDPGHGPYLTFPTRVSYDDEKDRFFDFGDVRVTSSTGAPADLHREDETSAVVLRIGDEDVDDVSGVQTYRVEMTVDGWINPANAQHSGDELYWNVIGPGWEVPLSDLSVTVTGPAPVQGAACFVGPERSTTPCDDATTTGTSATFTQGVVTVGDQFTTVTGWPGGTFPGVQPILRDKPDPVLPLRPLTVGGGVAAAVVLLGGGLAIGRVRRTGRDRAYLGLTPGLRPADGFQPATGYRDHRAPVAVQFQPPEGARPGEIGTLVDEKADPVDVTATIIDLAVRGWLRIEEVPRTNPRKKPKDWTLVRLRPGTEGLLPFEAWLLSDLFEKSDEVRLSELKATFASSLAKVQSMLYDHVTSVGWFRANPKSVRTTWIVVGILLASAGLFGALVATAIQVVPGLALVGIALLIVGVLVLVLSGSAPARTPDGTAVLAQALGFRRYLATAEADQIRFEEGQDVFSRYLPYAIVFGLADRWSRVFAELAAQGVAVAAPIWYVGAYPPGADGFWGAGFVGALDRFESITTAAISAPTPGSSGDSGFSGGGFSGGGVGGGGGGGW
ncbi:DUF2207 domain-containing protein [Cellulomonas xiejunii]|uniref:DUF2207 domain-containing protein n=1 Tax=Cellulomonas xiejunii TaxID=2968083 RepID=UPI001D0F0391|nr:DUF2207 domain-containing protein [Cellulomonas xiejunii]MCC2315125.1 DUF2207 domain-containing protein [Cellulomonas xiejunii]MCC2315670.1 DUF2207 domain-containing protein [Cellulomonas xiejunii]